MSFLSSKELKAAKSLIDEGKYEEALQHLKSLEQEVSLTREEKLGVQYYYGWLHSYLGQFDKSLKIVEDLYQNSQELANPIYTLGALGIKGRILMLEGRFDEFFTIVDQSDDILKSIPIEDSLGYHYSVAILLLYKGMKNFFLGKLDLALDYTRKSLAFLEQYQPFDQNIAYGLVILGYAYQGKGELDLALKSHKKALSTLSKGEYFFQLLTRAAIYRNMGNIYYEKGDLDLALEYNKRSLEIYEKIKGGEYTGLAFFNLISVLLAKKNFTQAQDYLQEFKQFNEKYKTEHSSLIFRLSKALILKSSFRMRDRVEAETIFKEIVQNYKTTDIVVINIALINLCDWYFHEFRISNRMEILDDIYPLIDRLQRNARYSKSYSSLAHVKLLQAKLALLQINMVEARKLLTEAQHIADEHGLQLLAGAISREHDRLLDELKLWESFKKTQASVSERLKLASIDSVLDRMQGKRAIEHPESTDEQPVLLLIMAEGGILTFSYPFSDKWKQDEDLFSSFLSAFTSFSDEFFSKGLDRAKFGEDTILIESVNSFSVCYLFKGQTYLAKQRLDKFIEIIQGNTSVWETLEKFNKSSQVVELVDIPKMKTILEEVFFN